MQCKRVRFANLVLTSVNEVLPVPVSSLAKLLLPAPLTKVPAHLTEDCILLNAVLKEIVSAIPVFGELLAFSPITVTGYLSTG